MSSTPRTRYVEFTLDKVIGVSAWARAEIHAEWAEYLLDGVAEGTYPSGAPTSVSVAAVHAQLATAWAQIANNQGGQHG